MNDRYEPPTISDYGSLTDMTEATGFQGNEDGGSKALIHHSLPIIP